MKHLSQTNRRSAKAFTLASTLVAMALLALLTAAALTAVTQAMFNLRFAEENDRATQILLEKAESIRLYNWDQINSNGFIPSNFNIAYDPTSTNQGITYNGSLTITDSDVSSSYSNDLKSVIVRVSWQTGGMQRQRELTTYVSRYGLEDYIY